jgi:hypothetical protein
VAMMFCGSLIARCLMSLRVDFGGETDQAVGEEWWYKRRSRSGDVYQNTLTHQSSLYRILRVFMNFPFGAQGIWASLKGVPRRPVFAGQYIVDPLQPLLQKETDPAV